MKSLEEGKQVCSTRNTFQLKLWWWWWAIFRFSLQKAYGCTGMGHIGNKGVGSKGILGMLQVQHYYYMTYPQPHPLAGSRNYCGTSLVVQWLRLCSQCRGAMIWSLVRELGSHMQQPGLSAAKQINIFKKEMTMSSAVTTEIVIPEKKKKKNQHSWFREAAWLGWGEGSPMWVWICHSEDIILIRFSCLFFQRKTLEEGNVWHRVRYVSSWYLPPITSLKVLFNFTLFSVSCTKAL